MSYSLEFYAPQVKADVLAWPVGIRANFFQIAGRMGEFGPNLGMPYTKALGGGLFEIRAKGVEGIGRAFVGTQVGQRIVILHIASSKKPKPPPNASLPLPKNA